MLNVDGMTALTSDDSVTIGVCCLFAIYYNLNLEYQPDAVATLEFIQRYESIYCIFVPHFMFMYPIHLIFFKLPLPLDILRFIRNARWDIMNIIRRILIENVSFLSDIVLNHYERGRRRQNFHNKAFQLFILQKNKDDAR
jgi:hypothetical protein